MLTYLTDYSQVGWYNAAVRVSTALHFIPFAIVGATFPAMSKFFVNSTEHLKSLYRKSLYYLIILALPMAMGGMILSSRIIHFVFGEQFAASGIIFAILIWAEAALFLNAITTNMLNAMNKQKLYSLITLCWAIFNIVFNYILITRIGYTGAAYTTMFTEFGLFVSTFAMLHYFGMKLNIIKLTWKPIAATLVMTATILLLQSFHFIIIIIASVVVYGGVLLLLKALDEQDKDMIKEMFNKLPFRPKTVDE
jgi:O-antigen/teichoic acid export membrane protein